MRGRVVRLRNGRHHWVVAREFDIDETPADICPLCDRLFTAGHGQELYRVVLPPSEGVLRKTGPLMHGTRVRRTGTRLG